MMLAMCYIIVRNVMCFFYILDTICSQEVLSLQECAFAVH